MMQISQPLYVVRSILTNLFAIGAIGMVTISPHPAVAASDEARQRQPPLRIKPATKPRLDFSGRRRVGIASFYADWFAGKKMANGVKMDPRANNAASRTLPLGTIARVTNLETRQSALVIIQDRGPYVQGRIVDLSPSTALKIGITRKLGIAKVRVTPIAIPLRKGRVELANRLAREQQRDACHCEGYRVALEQDSTKLE